MRSDSYHSPPGASPIRLGVVFIGRKGRESASGPRERCRNAARMTRLIGTGVSRARSSLTPALIRRKAGCSLSPLTGWRSAN
jgi:hypothetical protein